MHLLREVLPSAAVMKAEEAAMHLLREVLPSVAVMKAEEAGVMVGTEILALVRHQGEHFHSPLEDRGPLTGLSV